VQLDWHGVDVIWDSDQSHRCTSLMCLCCWRDVTRGRPERWRSKTPQQWPFRFAMHTKMSSNNALCQSSLEHTNSDQVWIHE
jgi:hypothetical protein